MTATLELDYKQIRDLVFQMPLRDRTRLAQEINGLAIASEPEIPFGPKTKEEAVARVSISEKQYLEGEATSAENWIDELKDEFQWLKEKL